MKKVSEDPKTTLIGSVLGFGGVVLSLLPAGVRDACFSAVNESGNPVIVSVLVSAGLILSFVGPSLAKKTQKAQGE